MTSFVLKNIDGELIRMNDRCKYVKNSDKVAGRRFPIGLSNSTKEAVQDHAADAKQNTPRIEIHTTDSGQPGARPDCNDLGRAFLDFSSLIHEQTECQDSRDPAKYFYQPPEWYIVLELLFPCEYDS